jgi:hypothetical protein
MITISSYQTPLRLDAAPTEVQMKLGISQVLSMPFAYNSPVIVLDFEVGNKNIIKGRFKDAIRSRVFEFEIGDSITFKPFTWKRIDSADIDPVVWEEFSKGYTYRYDAVKTKRKEKPKCGNTSYNCGKACIGLNKNCKSDLPDKPSQEKVDKLRAAAGKFKAVQDDPTKKQEDNKLTPKPPEPLVSEVKKEATGSDRAKRPNGYLVPIAGDSVYSVTGSLIGSKKWKAKVLKVNPDGNTMVIEKGWEKTKAGKPSKMTVPTGAWTVEDDPQKQKDIDKNLAEKKAEEIKAEKLSKQSVDSVDSAIKSAVDSGTERVITKDDLKKGDTFYLYLKMDRTGDHIKQKYEYTRDAFAKEILPDGSKESETYVLSPDVKITVPVVSPSDSDSTTKPIPLTTKAPKTPKAKVAKTPKQKAIKVEDNSPPRPKLKSKDNSVNELYDNWLESESKKLEGRNGTYKIETKTGSETVDGQIYGNLGVNRDSKSPTAKYNVTHVKSGMALGSFDDESQAKKAIVDLGKSDVDWSLDRDGLKAMSNAQGKMKKVKTIIDTVIESDKRVKSVEAVKQKSVKVQGERSQEQESPLVPKEEIVKDTPKRIGDGTHRDAPTNAQEYYDMATKAGIEITEDEAKATHEAIRRWTQDSDPVRNSQKENKPNEDANLISKYIANTTPYNDERFEGIKGEIHRGINFASEKEAMNWLKGDKDGILDNQGAHASWTSREDYAEDYAKRRGFGREGQPVMIKTINKTGVSIKKMGPTEYILQNEVIVPKEAKHKVKNITKKDGIIYVETEEVTDTEVQAKKSESPLITIGNGTHKGTPKNAQEYYEAMVKKGENITIEEAEKIIKSVKRWITDSDEVRDDQKDGRPNKNEENINRFMKSMTPYDGDVSRGILFYSREEVETWLKGDENGVLDNQKAHASWTSDDKVAYDFSKASYKENPSLSQYVEGAYPVIIKAKNKTGVSIKDVGLKPQESEVIVSKDAKHKVKSVTEKDGIFYVQTEEITNSDADKKIAPTAVQEFTAPRTLGDGTHEGTPKNAQEYSDMMAKKGQKIGIQDAEGVIESVKEWSENAYEIREDQKNGRSSKDADNLDLFIKQSTPFPGEISRGLNFDSEEELNKFVKGEDGILGNQNAHASWTSNYEKAKDFAGMNLSSVKKTYPVIVKAPNKSGVSIRNLSTFGQREDEVVVSKNTRHKIKSVRKEGDLTIIETEEI